MYPRSLGLRRSYYYKFKDIKVEELTNHDGVVVRDSVPGGSSGAIYCQWQGGRDYKIQFITTNHIDAGSGSRE